MIWSVFDGAAATTVERMICWRLSEELLKFKVVEDGAT